MMRRSNPFDEIESMFERMSRQFDGANVLSHSHGIDVDVRDGEEAYLVAADLPGFEKEDIDLSVAERALTISASREVSESTGSEEDEYLHRERRHESVRRTLRIPGDVDADGASAAYKNGVLTITLPKMRAESDDSRDIDID